MKKTGQTMEQLTEEKRKELDEKIKKSGDENIKYARPGASDILPFRCREGCQSACPRQAREDIPFARHKLRSFGELALDASFSPRFRFARADSFLGSVRLATWSW
jgi:hypothetical protein